MDPLTLMLGGGVDPTKDPEMLARQLRGQRDLGNFLGLSTIDQVSGLGQAMRKEAQQGAARGGALRRSTAAERARLEQQEARLAAAAELQDKRLEATERNLDRRLSAADRRAAADRNAAMDRLERRFALDGSGEEALPEQKALTGPQLKELGFVRESIDFLGNSLAGFKDEFSGGWTGEIGGRAQNWLQNAYPKLADVVGLANPEQAAWWSDYAKNLEALERNRLFGATLPEGEQAQWEAIAINPGMDPKEIRRRLALQKQLLTNKLQRQAKSISADDSRIEAVRPFLEGIGQNSNLGSSGGSSNSSNAGATNVLTYNPATGKAE